MNLVTPKEILWAFIGLVLTVASTFVDASIANAPWQWGTQGIAIHALGITWQVGAVLFISCVGGSNAGALSQIAYLSLGLTQMPVFGQGGGWAYIHNPTFGYLLGFVPGAWICGTLAFRGRPQLDRLALSCGAGLVVIHLLGLGYLVLLYSLDWISPRALPLSHAVAFYSIHVTMGQLAIACGAALLALICRRFILFE